MSSSSGDVLLMVLLIATFHRQNISHIRNYLAFSCIDSALPVLLFLFFIMVEYPRLSSSFPQMIDRNIFVSCSFKTCTAALFFAGITCRGANIRLTTQYLSPSGHEDSVLEQERGKGSLHSPTPDQMHFSQLTLLACSNQT